MRGSIGAALRRFTGTGNSMSAPTLCSDSQLAVPNPVEAEPTTAVGAEVAAPAPEADSKNPADHARHLLVWLQTDGGTSGEVFAAEIQGAYREMCAEHDWQPLSWLRVGREFAKLVGPRRYRDVIDAGKRCRRLVYAVPPDGTISTPIERARHPSAPLPARLTAIETTLATIAEQVGKIAAHVAGGAGPEARPSDVVVHLERRS